MHKLDIINDLLHKLGYELGKYRPQSSHDCRLITLLTTHNVDLVLDVGAASGSYAEKLRRLGYRGSIISFEPLKQAHEQLLARSRRDELWRVAPRMALGDREGELAVNVAANSDSSSILPMLPRHSDTAAESAYVGKEVVTLRTLDSIWGDVVPTSANSMFIKLDVQGYEGRVVMGGTNMLSRASGLQVEMSFVPLYEGQPLFDEMVARLKGYGFELHAMIPGFTDRRTGRMLQADGVFFRDDS